jgi:hypothetical protein
MTKSDSSLTTITWTTWAAKQGVAKRGDRATVGRDVAVLLILDRLAEFTFPPDAAMELALSAAREARTRRLDTRANGVRPTPVYSVDRSRPNKP